MRVSVKYLGHLRDELGEEEVFDLFSDYNPHLLSEILDELSKREGEAFSRLIYRSGEFNPHITVIVNEKVITSDKVTLDQDSSILFIPYAAGG